MSIIISLPHDTEEIVKRRAAMIGKTVDQYVTDLVQDSVSSPTLSEILAPVHDEFRASGMSDGELDALLKSELDAYRAERAAKKDS